MKNKTLLLVVAFLVLWMLWQRAFGQTILENYIQTGLDSNLALKQSTFDLEKAKIDLDRARALFYPQVDLNSQYTWASGGRTIEVPIGDLLNNVYSSLNQLTSSTKFPHVENQSIQFLPNNFQDSKIGVTLPLYNPSLSYNKKIKQELINTQQLQVDLYKRELVYNIKSAYYQYLQAAKAVAIYNNALNTVNESLRYSEKLVKNNAATKDVMLKAKAEVSQVQISLEAAKAQQKNAAAYFNFLLNQPLETPLLLDSSILQTLQKEVTVSIEVPAQREELKQISSSEKVLETSLKMDETYKLPVLNGFYNVGFQGYGFQLGEKQFYQFGGLQLQWSIFKGNDNKLKAKQTEIDITAIQNQYEAVAKQLTLQVVTAYNQYQSAMAAMHFANDEVLSTQEAYRLTENKYKQGESLQIELIDARTEMTNAEIKYSLTQLAVLDKSAALERATASYALQ
jgi:outer membrane protein TolC